MLVLPELICSVLFKNGSVIVSTLKSAEKECIKTRFENNMLHEIFPWYIDVLSDTTVFVFHLHFQQYE